MKLIKGRLDRLEEKAGRGQKPMYLVGIVGVPEDEERYRAYLRSGGTKPFIWFETGIRRSLDVSQTTSAEDDENDD